jgi:hypothetical protein
VEFNTIAMIVTAGDFKKNIPQEYARAVEILTLSDWEKPDKVRLTPVERFRFAEAAWRAEQPKNIREYLDGRKPLKIIHQHNRQGETRIVVRYDEVKGIRAQAIVPKWVGRACPAGLVEKVNEDWRI